MPFFEDRRGRPSRVDLGQTLHVSTDAIRRRSPIAGCVVVVIGTPVDEHLNPTFHAIRRFFSSAACRTWSTAVRDPPEHRLPRYDAKVRQLARSTAARTSRVTFCPERVAEGHAFESSRRSRRSSRAFDERGLRAVRTSFAGSPDDHPALPPMEAELTKIFTNAWRYIQFATANQFFMIATDYGLDFNRIFQATDPRLPADGRHARARFRGRALPVQGHDAARRRSRTTVPPGPRGDADQRGAAQLRRPSASRRSMPLADKRVGMLGMAFKAESDDPATSLSYKLRKVLEYEAAGGPLHRPIHPGPVLPFHWRSARGGRRPGRRCAAPGVSRPEFARG